MHYLGIDESGNGVYPLIYSCYISVNKESLVEGKFPKRRSKNKKQRMNNLIGFPNKHLIFERKLGKITNYENYKTIAIGEFSKFYLKNYNLNGVYIDGGIEEFQKEKILQMIYAMDKRIKINFGKDLDRKLVLVNKSDNWANFIFRSVRDSPRKIKEGFFDFLPLPDIRDYEIYLI